MNPVSKIPIIQGIKSLALSIAQTTTESPVNLRKNLQTILSFICVAPDPALSPDPKNSYSKAPSPRAFTNEPEAKIPLKK